MFCLLILLFFIPLVLSQKDYKYELLNNTIELKLIDSEKHFILVNISSYNVNEKIHIFLKMPTGGGFGEYKKSIYYFTLTEDYNNLEDINIPDNIQNINVKMEKQYYFYTNFYIEYEKNDKNIKYLIILIHGKNKDIYGNIIITDLDESKRIELNIKDNITYNFENSPLLLLFNMKEYNNAYFKFNSKFNILENYEIKYTHFLRSVDLFTSFQEKKFNVLKREQCFSIKNDENNYTIYFNFIHDNCCTSYAFIINPLIKGELTIESQYYPYIQNVNINDFNETVVVNNVRNQLALRIINAKPLTGNYMFFVIYHKYNNQFLSQKINFLYSLSNENYNFNHKNLNLNNLECKYKELENLNNIYYCQIYLNNYNSSQLLLFFLGDGGIYTRLGHFYEWVIPLNLYSKYTNLLKEKQHYSIGIGDLIENQIYYFKIIVHSFNEVNFNAFLSKEVINNLNEIKNPINIKFDSFSYGINYEQFYYFNLNNSGNSSLLLFDILCQKDTNITIENTKSNENSSEFYYLEQYETKNISNKVKNLFLTFNVTNFKKGENIYMIFEGSQSTFFSNNIFYTMNLNSDKINYITSEKCINQEKDNKFLIFCNYTKTEENLIKFILLLNPNNYIQIQNSINYEYKESNSSKILIIILTIVIILIIVIISIVIFIIIKKKRINNSNIKQETNNKELVQKELNEIYSLNN